MNVTDGKLLRPTTVLKDLSCEVDMSSEERFYAFICYGILLNIVGFFGILGNMISMIVLSRPQLKSSINCLLVGLARFDTVLIVTSMLLFGLPSIYTYSGHLFTYYYLVMPHMSVVLYPVMTIAQTGSVYMTLAVTLERYLAVCHPLKARWLCTYSRARIYVYAIIMFSVLYNLPRFWEITLFSNFVRKYNTTIYCGVASELRKKPTYISVYIQWLSSVFKYFVPFILLAIFNIAIIRQVRRANAARLELSLLQRREIRLATMLLFVVAVFFLCITLPLIVNILESFFYIFNNYLVYTSNLFVTINSSVNFIIYVTFGRKFKHLFIELFCNRFFKVAYKPSQDDTTNSARKSNKSLQFQHMLPKRDSKPQVNVLTEIS